MHGIFRNLWNFLAKNIKWLIPRPFSWLFPRLSVLFTSKLDTNEDWRFQRCISFEVWPSKLTQETYATHLCTKVWLKVLVNGILQVPLVKFHFLIWVYTRTYLSAKARRGNFKDMINGWKVKNVIPEGAAKRICSEPRREYSRFASTSTCSKKIISLPDVRQVLPTSNCSFFEFP